jgi:hypothetical protein
MFVETVLRRVRPLAAVPHPGQRGAGRVMGRVVRTARAAGTARLGIEFEISAPGRAIDRQLVRSLRDGARDCRQARTERRPGAAARVESALGAPGPIPHCPPDRRELDVVATISVVRRLACRNTLAHLQPALEGGPAAFGALRFGSPVRPHATRCSGALLRRRPWGERSFVASVKFAAAWPPCVAQLGIAGADQDH